MADKYELSHTSGAIKIPEQGFSTERGSVDRDEADLVRLGKKPVLKVSAGSIFQLLAFTLTLFL